MSEVLVIDMNAREHLCRVCGSPCDATHGVPMYEDRVLANDDPGPWVGQPACLECFEKQQRMTYIPEER